MGRKKHKKGEIMGGKNHKQQSMLPQLKVPNAPEPNLWMYSAIDLTCDPAILLDFT